MKIACPGCQAPYTVPDDAVGKKTRCKKCGHGFAIAASPPAEEPFVPELIEEPPPPAPVPDFAPPQAPALVTLQPVSSLAHKLVLGSAIGLAAGVVIVVTFLVIGRLATRNPNVTLENFRKLQCGMTLTEIETILGRGTKLENRDVPFHVLQEGRVHDVIEWHRWRDGGNTIHVGLNGPEAPPRVAGLHWSAATHEPGGIISESSESQYGRVRDVGQMPPPRFQADPKPKVAISRAVYDRIQHGMTESQVIEVLGPPTQAEDAGDFAPPGLPAMPGRRMRWMDVEAGKYIVVGMVNGRVTAKLSSEGPASIQGFKGELDPKTGLPKLPKR